MNKTILEILLFFGLLACAALAVFVIMAIVLLGKYLQSRNVGLTKKTPEVPFKSNHLSKKEYPNKGIQFYCGFIEGESWSNTCLLRAKLAKALKIVNVPSDARVISVKMDGFDFGSEGHSFEPMDGMGRGSYFTYQMFGDDRIQVTTYVENEVSYVAGFAIYIPDGSLPVSDISYRLRVIEKFMESPKYKCTRPIITRRAISTEEIPKRTTENVTIPETTILLDDFETEDWNVKRCGKLRRDVMTTVSDGSVYHKEWNVNLLKMKIDKCDVCSSDLDLDLLPPSYASLSMV